MASELPRRCSRQRSRLDAHHVDGPHEHASLNRLFDLADRGGSIASRFGDDDQLLSGAAGPRKRRHAAASHALDVGREPLDRLRMDVPAIQDDQILDPPGHVQLAGVEITQISGAQPTVAHRRAPSTGDSDVAGRDRWPAQADFSFRAVGKPPACGIHDGQLVLWKRVAAGHMLERIGLGVSRRDGCASLLEDRPVDSPHAQRTVQRLHRRRQRRFRQAVRRHDAVYRQAPLLGEHSLERLDCFGLNRLRAAAEDPEARKIPVLDIGGARFSQGQIEREIGRERDRAAVRVDGIHPHVRVPDEAKCGDEHDRDPRVHRRQDEPDVIAVDRLARETADVDQRAEADLVRPARQQIEAEFGDHAVLADEGDDIRERADGTAGTRYRRERPRRPAGRNRRPRWRAPRDRPA